MAKTIKLGTKTKNTNILIETTKKSLMEAIKLIRPGVRIGTIQNCIQKIIESEKLGLVKDLTGHGIGKVLQEKPTIPNFSKPNTGIILQSGMTFCLEPMVTLGNGSISIEKDGWTIISADHTSSAHFEHTILVTDKGHKILTLPNY